YARTTARDIVAASGTNLASIGYHYGSKEALLNQALIEATGDWGEEMGATIARHGTMLAAHFEAVVQAQHSEELKTFFGSVQDEGRYGLAEVFYGLDR